MFFFLFFDKEGLSKKKNTEFWRSWNKKEIDMKEKAFVLIIEGLSNWILWKMKSQT